MASIIRSDLILRFWWGTKYSANKPACLAAYPARIITFAPDSFRRNRGLQRNLIKNLYFSVRIILALFVSIPKTVPLAGRVFSSSRQGKKTRTKLFLREDNGIRRADASVLASPKFKLKRGAKIKERRGGEGGREGEREREREKESRRKVSRKREKSAFTYARV